MAVYFIRNTHTRSIKIGTSIDPEGRIRSLQTSCEHRLETLHIEWGWTEENERALHARFAHLRVGDGGREWFQGAPELLAFISAQQSRHVERANPFGLWELAKIFMWIALVSVSVAAVAVALVGLVWLGSGIWSVRGWVLLALIVVGVATLIRWGVRRDREAERRWDGAREARQAESHEPPAHRPA